MITPSLIADALTYLTLDKPQRMQIVKELSDGKRDGRFIAPDVWITILRLQLADIVLGVSPGDMVCRVRLDGDPCPWFPNAHYELNDKGRAFLRAALQ